MRFSDDVKTRPRKLSVVTRIIGDAYVESKMGREKLRVSLAQQKRASVGRTRG